MIKYHGINIKSAIFLIEKPNEIYFYKGFREPIYASHNELIGFRIYNEYFIWNIHKFLKYYEYDDVGIFRYKEKLK